MPDEEDYDDPDNCCGCCGELFTVQEHLGYQSLEISADEAEIICLDTGTKICGFCCKWEIESRSRSEEEEEDDLRNWRMHSGYYD